MMEPIDVSVIICVRNGAATIGAQLCALDAQMEHPAFEVIIVDNGSTDGTQEVVRRWIDSRGHAAVHAELLDAGREPGIPRARNAGALAARGRLLAFCDADDTVGPRWVGAFSRAVTADAMAGGRILGVLRSGEERHSTFGPGLIATTYLPHVGNCNCAVPRELFLRIGGYDESLPRYGFEDVDISWRLQEAGIPLVYVEEAEVHFVLADDGASVRKRFDLGRGRVLMAFRFPAYDSSRYTILSCSADVLRRSVAVIHGILRSRRIDRRAASGLVASCGRLAGTVQYGVRGYPERKLLEVAR